jgi:hypothetical protein
MRHVSLIALLLATALVAAALVFVPSCVGLRAEWGGDARGQGESCYVAHLHLPAPGRPVSSAPA